MKDFARLVEAYAAHPLGARVLPEALRLAVIYSRIEMVKLLLERGVDPNSYSERGRGHTPLMHAAHDGQLECVRLLLEAGADVHVRNDDGRTALDAAEGWANSSDEHLAIVELLKARGAKSKGQER
jgi:ankyrin repeat protein